MTESTVGYGNERGVVEALDGLARAVRQHGVITALAGFEAYGLNKLGARYAVAVARGDEDEATRALDEIRGLVR